VKQDDLELLRHTFCTAQWRNVRRESVALGVPSFWSICGCRCVP